LAFFCFKKSVADSNSAISVIKELLGASDFDLKPLLLFTIDMGRVALEQPK
jgi:hypothetical protein